jgi:hypothetical protein
MNDPTDDYWLSLPIRTRYVLVQRSLGKTLDFIGEELSCSRENVRLIEKSFTVDFEATLEKIFSSLRQRGDSFVWSTLELSDFLGIHNEDLLKVVWNQLKLRRVTTPNGNAFIFGHPDWVTTIRQRLPLTEQEVFSVLGVENHIRNLEIAQELSGGKWVQGVGIIRKTAALRDEILLRLLLTGYPVAEEELAEMCGVTIRNLRANVDRDPRLIRNFALNLVGLSDWKMWDFSIKSAQEALIRVLDEFGPLKQSELIKRAITIFPRTHGRYLQALEDSAFGLTDSGAIGLVSAGAKKAPDKEPKPHSSVREHSDSKVSTEIPVTKDVLRGAGIPVHRRLGWLVGLRNSGDSSDFKSSSGILKVRRQPGAVALSSMRVFVERLELAEGCKFELALDLQNRLFGLRATCSCHWLVQLKKENEEES